MSRWTGPFQIRRGMRLASLVLALLFGMLAGAFATPLEGRDFKMAGDRTHVRVVISFNGEPDPKFLLLRGPHRLVIDLPETRLVIEPRDLKASGLIKGVRYGQLKADDTRLILTGRGPFRVDNFQVVKNETTPGYRLAVDLSASSESDFEAALALQAETTGSTSATAGSDHVGQAAGQSDGRFTIVIDPGHGGIDGGAEGRNGTVEKDITLTFATELRDRLRAGGRYEVFMTREADEFLRLDERVRIARQHGADLFISVHADTINLKGIRGATVYTIADKASDAEAQALADRENLSDQLAGMEIEEENREVADILIDLIRRETHGYSIRFARSLVEELSHRVGLINNPHRFAGFRVLKAPDVPSVLVELGYLSNARDEAQLQSAQWRGKAAASIAEAIDTFASGRSGAGG
jgi:N-acetylmuramoyl-L-alanine amidase